MAAIGISFGSAYTCAAVWRGLEDKVEMVKLEERAVSMPTIVAFTPEGRLFGVEARDYSILDPKNTIIHIQRILGRPYDDYQLQMDKHLWSFKMINEHNTPVFKVTEKGEEVSYTAEQITAMFLSHIKEKVEKHLTASVTKVVLSVPAWFNCMKRNALRQAAILAGFEVLRISNDCTSAAVAHRLFSQELTNIIVYDIGGTMTTVSHLAPEGSIYEMRENIVNHRLGGNEFDNRIVAYFNEYFERQFGVEIFGLPAAHKRLKMAAEEAKWPFSDPTVNETTINVPGLYQGQNFSHTLTREMFDSLCTDLYEDSLLLIDKILTLCRLNKTCINAVLVVGGCGKITTIKRLITEFFDGRLHLYTSANPDEVIAMGNAIQAALLNGVSHPSINHKVMPDMLLASIGVEASKGVMVKVLHRNRHIPCMGRKLIPVLLDMDKEKFIKIYEGERAVTEHNNLIVSIPLYFEAEYNVDKKVMVILKIEYTGDLRVFVRTPRDRILEPPIDQSKRMSVEEINRRLAIPPSVIDDDLVRKSILESRYKMERYICDVHSAMSRPGRLNDVERRSMVEELEKAMEWYVLSTDCTKDELERRFLELSYRWVEITHKIFDRFWTYKPVD